MKPKTAKIKQNEILIWEGRVQFNESKVILDLRSIIGYDKFLPLQIEFYKIPSQNDEAEWTKNVEGEKI